MPGPKYVNYVALKNDHADYLAKWMPHQKAKGLRGTVTATPSEDAMARLRQCLGACIVLDAEAHGLSLDHRTLDAPGAGPAEAARLFRRFEQPSVTYVAAFKRAFQAQFGKTIMPGHDPWRLIGHDETAGWVARGGMPARLDQKIHILHRRIAMIENTITLLKAEAEEGTFGSLEGGPFERRRCGDYEAFARVHMALCERFLARHAPPPPPVFSTVVGTTDEVTRAEQCVMREAKAMGLKTLKLERVIEFPQAKVTFKAGATAGASAAARYRAQMTTAEERTNARAEAARTGAEASNAMAAGSASASVFLGLTAAASMEVESRYFDASLSGEASAGAQAKVAVSGSIRPSGAGGMAELEAFVGLQASLTGKVTTKMFGRPLVTQVITGKAMLGVGAGGKIGLDIDVFDGAKATLGFELAVGAGTGATSETTVNHYNIILAGHRGGHELLNLWHNHQVRAQGYQRLDHGTLSQDHQLHDRLIKKLKTMLTLEEERMKHLRRMEGIAGQGRTRPGA